ncbi:hypothetical protein KIN20_034533 [Parelaphostrongylus tenuis]|uniref:Uncharacterized protein n=1 Tax=Parelaphostrongylus tenuis TaxID=148309 RepID=A0AAD5R9T7_PARTN|nr:hypothetical protein KIN20_034533 [Parelaphostrongylus tenuis]
MPQGQAITRNFTVTGFRLPTAMVFTTSTGAAAQLPGGIAIADVLEQQGRSALLPDAIISMILSQIMVQINYDPLECKKVTVGIPPNSMIERGNDVPHCVVVGGTVTILCGGNMMNDMCNLSTGEKTEAHSCETHVDFRKSYGHEHLNGELV